MVLRPAAGPHLATVEVGQHQVRLEIVGRLVKGSRQRGVPAPGVAHDLPERPALTGRDEDGPTAELIRPDPHRSPWVGLDLVIADETHAWRDGCFGPQQGGGMPPYLVVCLACTPLLDQASVPALRGHRSAQHEPPVNPFPVAAVGGLSFGPGQGVEQRPSSREEREGNQEQGDRVAGRARDTRVEPSRALGLRSEIPGHTPGIGAPASHATVITTYRGSSERWVTAPPDRRPWPRGRGRGSPRRS